MESYRSALAVLIASIALSTCSAPTPPPIDENPKWLAWNVDTIAPAGVFQTLMYDVWAYDTSTMYVVGHSSGSSVFTMFEANGPRWQTTKFHATEGGLITGALLLRSVFGFSRNDVWVVGERAHTNMFPPPTTLDSSLVIHFNGTAWEEFKIAGRHLSCVWGTDPTNVWVGSVDGFLYRFNQISWSKWRAPRESNITSISGFRQDDVYASAISPASITPKTYYVYHWDGMNWSVVDSTVHNYGAPSKFGGAGLEVIGNHLISYGFGAFRYDGSSWTSLGYDPETWFNCAFGTSADDFYLAGNGGKLFHYANATLARIEPFQKPSMEFVSGTFVNNMIIAVGQVDGHTLVLRGVYR